MAKPADPRRAVVRRGTFSSLLAGLAQGPKWLLLSLLLSILIEWAGMMFWWEAQGAAHSRQMLANELHWLGTGVQQEGWMAHISNQAYSLPDRAYSLLFEQTGIVELVHWITPAPSPHESDIRAVLHRLHAPISEYVVAAMQMTQVFIVRLTILALSLPVFALFVWVALVDGLVLRDLRRWGGGRESSFVYHYARKATLPLFLSAWVLYLVSPVSVHPSWILLPFALTFALAVRITASTFKKYL
ncbi:MAG: TIGR03747 family integrating conjugative element membrane protein [Gammaproteobacteria bacterium]|nr:TIGR03747 family integrating conjugative element membrane protein [Gammaproteobacteria bacterium]